MNITERERNPDNSRSYNFSIYRPGGNDTCLVEGIPGSLSKRKDIQDMVMGIYPAVEQVGFVDIASSRLEMAGGEFCGNATRSAAWKTLNGKPGEIEMQVSGVRKKLKAGVTRDGEAFAQMPIYSDPSKISNDGKNYIVEMEGITHIIDLNPLSTQGKTEDELKAQAMKVIKEKGLDKGLAAGVIYAQKDSNKDIKIDPIVYVRNSDTLFYETACGSGTTALGMVLALQNEKSLQAPITQPSGKIINITVNYDGKTFNYAEIKGDVETLISGSVEANGEFRYLIEDVKSQDALDTALSSKGLRDLYKDVFSQEPYGESFRDYEIDRFFNEYLNDGLLYIAKNEKKVIGFGAALPLSSVPEIADIIKIDRNKGWYMADLGVSEEFRMKGIARKLVDARLKNIPQGNSIVMRTSENNIASQNLYLSLGFEQIKNAYQLVKQERIDGTVREDKRIFLIKK